MLGGKWPPKRRTGLLESVSKALVFAWNHSFRSEEGWAVQTDGKDYSCCWGFSALLCFKHVARYDARDKFFPARRWGDDIVCSDRVSWPHLLSCWTFQSWPSVGGDGCGWWICLANRVSAGPHGLPGALCSLAWKWWEWKPTGSALHLGFSIFFLFKWAMAGVCNTHQALDISMHFQARLCF